MFLISPGFFRNDYSQIGAYFHSVIASYLATINIFVKEH